MCLLNAWPQVFAMRAQPSITCSKASGFWDIYVPWEYDHINRTLWRNECKEGVRQFRPRSSELALDGLRATFKGLGFGVAGWRVGQDLSFKDSFCAWSVQSRRFCLRRANCLRVHWHIGTFSWTGIDSLKVVCIGLSSGVPKIVHALTRWCVCISATRLFPSMQIYA